MKKTDLIFVHSVKSPLGNIRLFANEKAVIGLYLEKEKVGKFHALLKSALPKKTKILALAEKELKLFFKHQLNQFTVPIEFFGTDFQKSVWNGLRKIRMGDVRTYGEHAAKVADQKAVRAVSAAIGRNPISIIVPCHRVVGKTGKLTGYAGGLEAKEWLLHHEGHKVSSRVISV